MKLYIIGKTEFMREFPGKAGGSEFEIRYWGGFEGHMSAPNDGQTLIEFAGRLCYESFDLPSEKTKENSGYIRNIISLGHESVLEHVSVTFYVEGVSRNLSHELIRHRHLSFSELSQRFVDMEDANYINPPAVRALGYQDSWPIKGTEWEREYDESLKAVKGTRKQKREAARFALPSAIETKFVVTGNLRAWRDVLKKRDSEHADAEMQLFAKEVKRQLLVEYPDVFADLDG